MEEELGQTDTPSKSYERFIDFQALQMPPTGAQKPHFYSQLFPGAKLSHFVTGAYLYSLGPSSIYIFGQLATSNNNNN